MICEWCDDPVLEWEEFEESRMHKWCWEERNESGFDPDESFIKGAMIAVFVIGVLMFLFFLFVVPAGSDTDSEDYLRHPQTNQPVLADSTPVGEPHTIEPSFTG